MLKLKPTLGISGISTLKRFVPSITPKRRDGNGYVLYENKDIVVIATTESDNAKTGNMVQIWILATRQNPVTAVQSSLDSVICGDCALRGNGFKDRTCYVQVGQGPLSVWSCWQRGLYPFLPTSHYGDVFAEREVRFGAYGDPAFIPLQICREITWHAHKWTGYTHQWRRVDQRYGQLFMASCESLADYVHAHDLGYRTFRVRSTQQPIQPNEITCPASDEAGKRTTCRACCLCNGRDLKHSSRDIVILAHGRGKRNFDLVQIERTNQ